MGHMKVRRIHSEDVARLKGREVQILKELLNDCFKLRSLQQTITWDSLMSGEAYFYGNGNYNDHRMISMVNSFQDPWRKAKLQHLFCAMDADQVVDLSNFHPSLSTLVPSVNGHLNEAWLSQVADIKLAEVNRYIANLSYSAQYSYAAANPHLSKGNNLAQLQQTLLTGNDWRSNCFMCVDVENYEGRKNLITEVGISIMDPTLAHGPANAPSANLINMHIIIEENQHLRNGRYVEDNRDNFTSGVSMVMSRSDAIKFIQCVVDYYFIERKNMLDMDCVFVGQGVMGDIHQLMDFGIVIPDFYHADTLTLAVLSLGRGNCSLQKLLHGMGCSSLREVDYLHNAGNDAAATLALFFKMVRIENREQMGLDEYDSRSRYDSRVQRSLWVHEKRGIEQREALMYDWDGAIIDVFEDRY